MNRNLNVPTRKGSPEGESAEYLSTEWLLKVPAAEVSAFLREAGFDLDKGLSPKIKQAIEGNHQRAKQHGKKRLARASEGAWYYSGMSIIKTMIVATMVFMSFWGIHFLFTQHEEMIPQTVPSLAEALPNATDNITVPRESPPLGDSGSPSNRNREMRRRAKSHNDSARQARLSASAKPSVDRSQPRQEISEWLVEAMRPPIPSLPLGGVLTTPLHEKTSATLLPISHPPTKHFRYPYPKTASRFGVYGSVSLSGVNQRPGSQQGQYKEDMHEDHRSRTYNGP